MKISRLGILLLMMAVAFGAAAQQPVKFVLSSGAHCFTGLPEKKDYIVVDFPGKSAHELYNMIAVNVGMMYYKPCEVMYGVQDAFIAVYNYEDRFCRPGSQNYFSANYTLRFAIKDGKVLVMYPLIQNLKQGVGLGASSMSFFDFVHTYWYKNGDFVNAENDNMVACETMINNLINQLLGLRGYSGELPSDW